MEENKLYDEIKSQLLHRKKQACIVSFVCAVLVLCALIYLGITLGVTSWQTWQIIVVAILGIAFSASAFSFLNGYIFRWSVDEFENIHYNEKDYIELTERVYKELKYK